MISGLITRIASYSSDLPAKKPNNKSKIIATILVQAMHAVFLSLWIFLTYGHPWVSHCSGGLTVIHKLPCVLDSTKM